MTTNISPKPLERTNFRATNPKAAKSAWPKIIRKNGKIVFTKELRAKLCITPAENVPANIKKACFTFLYDTAIAQLKEKAAAERKLQPATTPD